MTKYIDAEKLKSEIQSLIDFGYDKLQGNLYHVISLINSLQQEQPEVDFENEIEDFLHKTGAPYFWTNDSEQLEWCRTIARHFYEFGRATK